MKTQNIVGLTIAALAFVCGAFQVKPQWIVFLTIGIGVAVLGRIYSRLRASAFPSISDDEFVREFIARHPVAAAPATILKERRRIARILGIPPDRLAPGQSGEALSSRLTFLAEFSIAWNDLADDAAEAREASGLGPREPPPQTIGELLEDMLGSVRGVVAKPK